MEEKRWTVLTQSAEQTEQCGAELAEKMLEDSSIPPFVALYGDLGVGKTAFVRGFTSVISPRSAVRSPTFALVNEYRAKPRSVFHFDMYRISNDDDLVSIGFYDYLERPGICLVEWSENIPYALPDDFVRVRIEKNDSEQPDSRLITVEQIGESAI
ncbi:MAG: tRNA (adenosine(37)-N6)-threonylcarbamoyltransferase complex ATPase subunit type 1 TsaE [Ruminococcaceae bacterium]|nr:tRNA (adenosine(37)-N6)-threonylcarbamoyltransferase complex ATPase subunit type 1 TsaE [Oscillospiraceae bacterium]